MNSLLLSATTYNPIDIAKYTYLIIAGKWSIFLGICLITGIIAYLYIKNITFNKLKVWQFWLFMSGIVIAVAGVFCIIKYYDIFYSFIL